MTEQAIAIKRFSIGKPKKLTFGGSKEISTAICKNSIEEGYLSQDGFHGDGVGDLKHHGGLDRAICIYPYEHYAYWQDAFDEALPEGVFGENLTVTGMLETDVHIGDIFKVGEAVMQVTQPRVPCSTITKRTGNPRLLQQIVEHGYTGFLCRVLEEGIVRSDSEIDLLERHSGKYSIAFCNNAYFNRLQDIESMEKLLTVAELAEDWKQGLRKRLMKFA